MVIFYSYVRFPERIHGMWRNHFKTNLGNLFEKNHVIGHIWKFPSSFFQRSDFPMKKMYVFPIPKSQKASKIPKIVLFSHPKKAKKPQESPPNPPGLREGCGRPGGGICPDRWKLRRGIRIWRCRWLPCGSTAGIHGKSQGFDGILWDLMGFLWDSYWMDSLVSLGSMVYIWFLYRFYMVSI